MASIDKMQNEYTNVGHISLTSGLQLEHGIIGVSGNIDGLGTGTTTLVTVPAALGANYLITHLIFNSASFSGVTGTLSLSVGTNAVTYDNIMPSTALTGFDTAGEVYIYPVAGTIALAVPTDNITVNITTAFTGGTFGLFEVAILGVIV